MRMDGLLSMMQLKTTKNNFPRLNQQISILLTNELSSLEIPMAELYNYSEFGKELYIKKDNEYISVTKFFNTTLTKVLNQNSLVDTY